MTLRGDEPTQNGYAKQAKVLGPCLDEYDRKVVPLPALVPVGNSDVRKDSAPTDISYGGGA
jgi:hypothetical protein